MTPSIGWAAPLGPGARETSATTGISGGPRRFVATVPADGATSVAVSTNLTVRFDAPMNATSVEAALGITPATAGDFAWNTTRTLLRFDPHLYLRYGTPYEVRLIGSLTRDANGQPLDGNGDGVGGDDYVFRFITEPDVTPPRVLAVAPAANSANASVTAEVEIVFSEPMDRASVEDAFSYTNRSFVWNASAGTFSWEGRTFPDDTAIFNPFENFPFAAYINTTMRASAQDSAGR